MFKINTIVGARPQFIKAAALSRAIRSEYSSTISEHIIHTGQHYDRNMSEVFFKELEIPTPSHFLEIAHTSEGRQLGDMIAGIENVLLEDKPDAVVVYGDTNSTLAGAIAASTLKIPLVHIEAGLRSFNKQMPEEINRTLTDHVSALLFCPTETAIRNLEKENIRPSEQKPSSSDAPGVFLCGDIMYDNSLFFGKKAESSDILRQKGLEKNRYILLTIHRRQNQDAGRLRNIFNGIKKVTENSDLKIIFPVHPATKQVIDQFLPDEIKELEESGHFRLCEPLSFLEMTALEKFASLVITDSGGVQKEACFFQKPAVILRSETEWVEIIQTGSSILVDDSPDKLLEAFKDLTSRSSFVFPKIFGDGNAAGFICSKMLDHLGR